MGALIALDYLPDGQGDLAGAVISGAPIAPVGVATPALVIVARVLSKVWPAFPLRTRLRADALSRDPEVVEAYRTDPLVHGMGTPRWGTEALDAVRRLHANAPRITLPLLFVHGGADRLNHADALAPYVARLGSTDTTLRIYPGSFHEPHNDLDRAQVVAEVGEWLERHAGSPTAGSAPAR
jgi:alpha-beta hydrolase superfamily lysophospholipase